MKQKRCVDDHAPLMVWSITDPVIENPHIRESEFNDLKLAGFGGVAAFVRCSRYSWDDPPAHAALAHISRLCRRAGMLFWLGPDPRFVSHKIAGPSEGLELLLFGNSTRADTWPNLAAMRDGRFELRCMLAPRHVHTLTDVAITYRPLGVLRAYAVRLSENGKAMTALRDITRDARMFHNARDGYVEAFGRTTLPEGEPWHVLAFFHVRSTHVDFSSDVQRSRYTLMLTRLQQAGCALQGIMWDEPGHTCTYGSLPYSPWIRHRYRAETGRQLASDLWKLAFDESNHRHVPARQAYYGIVQASITAAEKRFKATARRLWGPATAVGIHDTWHFESGDMCDMNHGSMDLWKTVGAKTGGFVDLGGVQQLQQPDAPWNANHAALTVIAASLGRQSEGGYAYNNLWTVGDDGGDGSQREAMEFCVHTMALFGVRWLAHAYGPVGTIGQERTFLGSPPLPGYPDHSTWKAFPVWNRFLREELARVEGRLPRTNLLMVFPVETLYTLGDQRADGVAAFLFTLILKLLDRHFHPEVTSSTCLKGGTWARDGFRWHRATYGAVVAPFASGFPRSTLRELQKGGGRAVCALEQMEIAEVLDRLDAIPGLRPVRGPEDSWITMTAVKEGTIVSLAPARCGKRFGGTVNFDGREASIGERSGLARILFPLKGEPRILTA